MLSATEGPMTCDFDDVATRNPHLLTAKGLAYEAAMQDGGILILGEPGTEKEMLAAAVHAVGKRSESKFVELDCAHLPGALMERAMFGEWLGGELHPMLRDCRGGTLLMQEAGALPLVIQSRIVGAMQTGRLALDSAGEADFDCRIIATTSDDLVPLVEDKLFRGDLYEALTQTVIFVPPLRHRKEDIPLLVQRFMREFGRRLRKPLCNISDEAMQGLTHYRWPGNVGELKTIIGRAALLAKGETILLQHLPRGVQQGRKYKETADTENQPLSLAVIEKRHIQKVLDYTGWHKVRSAQILGIDRSTLYDKIKRYDLANPADRLLGVGQV